jgi:hypothetical protein
MKRVTIRYQLGFIRQATFTGQVLAPDAKRAVEVLNRNLVALGIIRVTDTAHVISITQENVV